ncbi:hypothetical protein H0H92_007926 [Tricholoma furcatifolium]|nr:hypothetical protein H0H92_007926 [Tricholoma furcatifolium]
MRVLVSAALLSALQLCQAINVYLSPQPASVSSSTAAISRHLGLDLFEPQPNVYHNNQGAFVAQGSPNSLLLTLDEVDAKAVLPPSFQPAFSLHTPSFTPIDSLSSVISTYLHRAAHTFASIYDGSPHSFHLAEFFETAEAPSFAGIELSKLSDLRQTYGTDSNEYLAAVQEIRQFISHVRANADTFHLAILTFSPSSHLDKRAPQIQATQSPFPSNPPPQEPISAVSTCFTSAEACANSTNSCSGRGQCLAATKSGRTCFVCTCGVTKSGEGSQVKTDIWVGEACERKDISGPFTLLTGTVIGLIILVFGSVSLLSSVGNVELPSLLVDVKLTPVLVVFHQAGSDLPHPNLAMLLPVLSFQETIGKMSVPLTLVEDYNGMDPMHLRVSGASLNPYYNL